MPLLDLRAVSLFLPQPDLRPILSEVDLYVDQGEVVGLVGESGSGKSTAARAAVRRFPRSARVSGQILWAGQNIMDMSGRELREFRTRNVSMVFQDPRVGLNPARRIGDFVVEQVCTNLGWSRSTAVARALKAMEDVGLGEPERRLRQYPHELSGGELQRVSIAAALMTEPALILADEPTSALDVTTQAEVLATLAHAQRERDLALLLITHDLQLASAFCDRVLVMYAGRVVEEQPAHRLFTQPMHPYTSALLRSAPDLEGTAAVEPVPGHPPSLADRFSGCPFVPRCAHAQQQCEEWRPELLTVDDSLVACRRAREWSADRPATAGAGGGT